MIFNFIYTIAQPLLRLYFRLCFGARCEGRENVPKTGGLLVCSNHKSNFDPPFVGSFLPRHMKYLAKNELFGSKFKSWFLHGIGAIPYVRGSGDIGMLKTIISLLKQDQAVAVFPEGTRNLKDINQVKSGAILFAIKAKVPILPAAVCGDYKRGKGLKVVYGKPKYYDAYYGQKLSQEELHQLALDLMREIYAMAGKQV